MKTFIVILSLIAATNTLAQKKDIRNTTWGSTLTQVKASESIKVFSETANGLMYKVSLDNKKFILIYSFIDNKLVRATYLYNEDHVNKNNYVAEYNSLKDILTGKYGEPTDDQINWSNDLYKDDPSNIGMAVSVGHVVLKSAWTSKDDATTIGLVCHGENFEIHMGIIYTSIKHKSLIDAEKAKQNDKDF